MTIHLQPGDTIWVRALKANGHCYRWWQAVVEEVAPGHLTTLTASGSGRPVWLYPEFQQRCYEIAAEVLELVGR